jgi:hypothetical protein
MRHLADGRGVPSESRATRKEPTWAGIAKTRNLAAGPITPDSCREVFITTKQPGISVFVSFKLTHYPNSVSLGSRHKEAGRVSDRLLERMHS